MNKYAEDIAEIKTDLKWIRSTLSTHISQHFRVNLAVLCSVIAAGVAVVLAFV